MKKLLLFLFLLIGTYCLQAQELEIVKDIIIRTKDLSERVFEGDYTGLNTEKICRVTGKRIKTGAMLFMSVIFIEPNTCFTIIVSFSI